MSKLFGAIDIGASSGRVIAGHLKKGKLSLSEVHRFPNGPKQHGDSLVWDIDELFKQVQWGIRELGARAERLGLDVQSIGIDTWAVDYGLVSEGELLMSPACYRDPHNELGVAMVHKLISPEELYQISGVQFLPFNTIYQLAKQKQIASEKLERADKALLLPDLIGYFLTGKMATELTNASSTGLLNVSTRQWDADLTGRIGLDPDLFPPLAKAGTVLGKLKNGFGPRLANTNVVLVGSHDTASSVVGVPSPETNFAFLSSGTWSLLGAEIAQPILTNASRNANFTNELGVDDRIRYLKNLSGLWLLSESMRFWEESGNPQDLSVLLNEAAVIQVDAQLEVTDPNFIAPGDMPLKIARQLESRGLTVPTSPAEFTSLILRSLASTYALAFADLEELTGLRFERLHITGGGSQNDLLCQLTADELQRTVVAGPVEATAIGNLLIQIRATEQNDQTLEDLRKIILGSDFKLRTFTPKERN
ncbi:MAG: hypothetical protein RL418_110 [Actinomycetota bacterium]